MNPLCRLCRLLSDHRVTGMLISEVEASLWAGRRWKALCASPHYFEFMDKSTNSVALQQSDTSRLSRAEAFESARDLQRVRPFLTLPKSRADLVLTVHQFRASNTRLRSNRARLSHRHSERPLQLVSTSLLIQLVRRRIYPSKYLSSTSGASSQRTSNLDDDSSYSHLVMNSQLEEAVSPTIEAIEAIPLATRVISPPLMSVVKLSLSLFDH